MHAIPEVNPWVLRSRITCACLGKESRNGEEHRVVPGQVANFYQASGGSMLVVCDNRSCMRNIRSLTNLADFQAGKRSERDSVWLEARNRG